MSALTQAAWILAFIVKVIQNQELIPSGFWSCLSIWIIFQLAAMILVNAGVMLSNSAVAIIGTVLGVLDMHLVNRVFVSTYQALKSLSPACGFWETLQKDLRYQPQQDAVTVITLVALFAFLPIVWHWTPENMLLVSHPKF